MLVVDRGHDHGDWLRNSWEWRIHDHEHRSWYRPSAHRCIEQHSRPGSGAPLVVMPSPTGANPTRVNVLGNARSLDHEHRSW
jgi:hypothetical protein